MIQGLPLADQTPITDASCFTFRPIAIYRRSSFLPIQIPLKDTFLLSFWSRLKFKVLQNLPLNQGIQLSDNILTMPVVIQNFYYVLPLFRKAIHIVSSFGSLSPSNI